MSLTIYKASAGAGKTFTLSATFIANLIKSEADMPHRHQLAVTFTNKATAEMKERILQYLYELAHSTDDTDGFFKAVRAEVPERITNSMIRHLAGRALTAIIHDYDHFHVTTIDSFFQSLLSNLAHELSLSANFKVEIGDKDILAKAVDRLMLSLGQKNDLLQWVMTYIRERMDNDKSWNVSSELKSLAGEIMKEAYMLNSHLLQRSKTHSSYGINLDNAVIEAYKKTLKDLMEQYRTTLIDKAEEADTLIFNAMPYTNISYGKSLEGFFEKIINCNKNCSNLPEAGTRILGYISDPKTLRKSDDKKANRYEMEANEVARVLKQFMTTYDNAINVINSCRLCMSNLNPLRLLDAIDAEVQALNKENDRVMLAYTPLLFHNLKGAADASFVFERAGTQYHHVMIDEFQDTSKLQWENMRQLLIENMAQGNSCMLVGDVKQGIYRFRGGDWNALAGFKEGHSIDLNTYINIKTLKTNFRSGKEIVNFNNRLFVAAAHVMQEELNEKWGIKKDDKLPDMRNMERIYPTPDPDNDTHEVTQLSHDEGGFVHVYLKNTGKKEKTTTEEAAAKAEAEDFCVEDAVAQQMLRLRATGVPYKEMAILIRWNKESKKLLDFFDEHYGQDCEHHIPLVSEEAFLLEASPAVQTIVHVLRYITNDNDDVAHEYIRLHTPQGREEEIEDTLNQWKGESYGRQPFYEIACRIVRLFALDKEPGQSPYLYSFLDAVLKYIEDNTADIKSFLTFWEETLHSKAIPSAATEGVRILTIHKSKGLAFHSVFLPYCNWKLDDKTDLVWVTPDEIPYKDIPLLPVYMTKEADKSIFCNTYRQEQFDKYAENLNLTYVAFTRARQNLLLWCDCSIKGIAPVLHSALVAAGYTLQADGHNGHLLECGTPSALGIDNPNDNDDDNDNSVTNGCNSGDNDSNDNTTANPLKHEAKAITLDMRSYDPKFIFRQSNNAQVFLKLDDEELPTQEEKEQEEAQEQQQAAQEQQQAAQEQYRQTGILLHELMSAIESKDDVRRQIENFERAGRLPQSLSPEQLTKLITRRMAHPTARQWFDGSWQLFRECTLIYKENGRLVEKRPDRVMTRGNMADGTDETIVIDFKFGRFKPEHREQVEHYMDLLRRQGRHHLKGYLWYLYNGSIEEVELPA